MMTDTPWWRAWLLPTALGCCLLMSVALAHIKNEASQFPDIEFSEARFDIVVLVGAGIIPETPVFEPDKPLSKRELATWIALTEGLGYGGETPDTVALAEAALEAGLLDTLEGDANYAELDRLFFHGEASVADPNATPTKAEAATFIAAKLDTDSGRALLEKRKLSLGTTGEITAVEAGERRMGMATYIITIEDTRRPMVLHGRVANGPTDLLQWQGRTVRRSFVFGEGDSAMWTFLEATPLEQLASDAAEAVPGEDAGAASAVNRNLLYGLIAAVVILGAGLFFRRRRGA